MAYIIVRMATVFFLAFGFEWHVLHACWMLLPILYVDTMHHIHTHTFIIIN